MGVNFNMLASFGFLSGESNPGVATCTVNSTIDGTTARFTLTSVPSDPDLKEIKVEYAVENTGTWTRSSAFSSNSVGAILDVTLTEGARYVAHLVTIDTSGHETINQYLDFVMRNPSGGGIWTEVTTEHTTPVWTEVSGE